MSDGGRRLLKQTRGDAGKGERGGRRLRREKGPLSLIPRVWTRV